MLQFPQFYDFSLPLLFGYAEIHYHLKYLYPRYYRREPEIIADVPIRCTKDITSELPVLIIVKDAHLFPIHLNFIKVILIGKYHKEEGLYSIDTSINQKHFSQIIPVHISNYQVEQWINITIEIHYAINRKEKICINDNYPNLKKQPFRFYFAEKKLPFPKKWFPGEPHYHSIHTSDQVEFGADIESTKVMAKAMGLKWFFVTDHSYDLDDCEDNCTTNDLELPIWKRMLKDCESADENDFRVIPGEEVSIGNSEGKNVHMLAINHPEFIEGSGDSAERWFRNKPQHKLTEIKEKHTVKNLFIAAHPFEKVPFMQKLTLRRGSWNKVDYKNGGIEFLQIINSSDPIVAQDSISRWTKFLLEGKRYFILAGNDAHGNFNVMRQIKSPFWKLFSSQKQTFGKFFTAFQSPSNDPVKGIKTGNVIVSNGPFLNFKLRIGKEEFPIGSVTKPGQARLIIESATSPEFGKISTISLHIGDVQNNFETLIGNPSQNITLDLPEKGYIRMSLQTEKGGLVFTNPVWID